MKPKPIRARKQTVFIVNGLRRILEITATIVVCEKQTWAELDLGYETRRHLLGTSAFFTRKAAEVRKLGELRKLAAVTMPEWHAAGQMAGRARQQLRDYEKSGSIH